MKIVGKRAPHFTLAAALCDQLWVECAVRRSVRAREFPCAFHMSHAALLYNAGVRGPARSNKESQRVVKMFRDHQQ